MMHDPFYDPNKSFHDNLENGPFGSFSDGKVYVREGNPEYDFFGEKIYQPFGIPAGPTPNYNFVKAALEKGFDLPVYKTVRTREHKTHPLPNIVPVKVPGGDLTLEMAMEEGLVMDDDYNDPIGITNSFGVGSFDPEIWQPDMKKAVEAAGKGQLVIGSFQGTNRGEGVEAFVDDHILGGRLVKETGAKVIEMNLSCPNEGTTDLLCFDQERVLEITTKVKEEIGNTPLFIKLAYFKDEEFFKKYVKEIGKIVDGFATINTIGAKIYKNEKKTEQALPGEGRLVSGVCGVPIRWAGLEMVERLNSIREEEGMDFKIIGVGGVTDYDSYKMYRDRGADAVMSATGAMWNPYLAQEIWKAGNN
jgi:dihydroorotate dehydrogenase